MTFKELREGNQYFILHKTDKPFCEVGSVIGVTNLRPKPQNMVNGYPAMQPEMIIDISVKVGDDTVKLSSVPADKSIADYKPENGEKLVLSCDQTMINQEISAMLQNSQQILASIETHKSIIDNCELMLNQLNPQFKKEKEQESKIQSLENEIAEMKKMFGGGFEELKSLLLEKQSTNNKKATT